MQHVETRLDDIVDTASRVGTLRAFCSAIAAAGLRPKLRSGGPFTVFAPNDDAFDRIAEHTLQSWLRPESSAQLMSILTYHMLQGRLPAEQIIASSSVRSVQGTSLTIRFARGRMHVNNAAVVQPDIGCSNGVIHIIDTVLVPR